MTQPGMRVVWRRASHDAALAAMDQACGLAPVNRSSTLSHIVAEFDAGFGIPVVCGVASYTTQLTAKKTGVTTIVAIQVHPHRRNEGVGTLMINWIRDNTNQPVLSTYIADADTDARAFFTACGFVDVGNGQFVCEAQKASP